MLEDSALALPMGVLFLLCINIIYFVIHSCGLPFSQQHCFKQSQEQYAVVIMQVVQYVLLALAALTLVVYHPYLMPLITYYRTSSPILDRIEALKVLVQSPAVGSFFYEDLVGQLALQQNWDQVLKYTNGAIQSPINENRFSIWYYKATSECLLSKLGDCEQSARRANSLASSFGETYVHELYKLSESMKNGKIKTMVKNDQILITITQEQEHGKQESIEQHPDKNRRTQPSKVETQNQEPQIQKKKPISLSDL